MFIQTEATPNPATLTIHSRPRSCSTAALWNYQPRRRRRSPLAEKLFGVPGVTSVFYGADFVTVTKADGDWQHLKPAILGAIMEHYMSGRRSWPTAAPAVTRPPTKMASLSDKADAETVEMIKDLIETRVRPAVADDGGDITFRGFKDGIVYLNMKGSCAGCPSSTARCSMASRTC